MADSSTHDYLIDLSRQLDDLLAARDHRGVRTALIAFEASAAYTPKYAFFKIEQILPDDALARLAIEMTSSAIERNTPEALERFHAGMGTSIKVAELYKDLHSQRSWAKWKLGDREGARADLATALEYFNRYSGPTHHGMIVLSAVDLMRFGIMSPDPDFGWVKIKEAIVRNHNVLDADSAFARSANELALAQLGQAVDFAEVVDRIIADDRSEVPHISLRSLDNDLVSWASDDQPTLVVFFSPVCGSCQQELRALGSIHESLTAAGRLLLVLNKPDSRERAIQLVQEVGLPANAVCLTTETSAYHYISGEPTTWIIDTSGVVLSRYVGYQSGDENKYRQGLLAACRSSE